ncbi:hypothetical protein MMC28_001633 [Mycoblastus sanguinarius]|nr:hypothetical protein [Mycoblastus sanguinarius]
MPEALHPVSHYEVLSLPYPDKSSTALIEQTVKTAYRRALLLHHPDKSVSPQSTKPKLSKYTVDEITSAYKTLIDPIARSEYDRRLTLKPAANSLNGGISYPGLETMDLDELAYDEVQGLWHRSCRCGKDRAYVVAEEELEMNAEEGELVTGCGGCSLWLRVTFAVVEDS